LGLTIDGLRVAGLGVSHTDNAFFVAVVDLDLPAVDVSLHDRLQFQVGVSADEEGRLAVEEFGPFAKAITDGFDYDEQQRFVISRFAPEDGAKDFDLEVSDLSDCEAGNFLKRNRVPAQDIFGGWSWGAVLAWSAFGCAIGVQRKVKVSVLADAPDEGGAGWKRTGRERAGPSRCRGVISSEA